MTRRKLKPPAPTVLGQKIRQVAHAYRNPADGSGLGERDVDLAEARAAGIEQAASIVDATLAGDPELAEQLAAGTMKPEPVDPELRLAAAIVEFRDALHHERTHGG